MSYPLPPTQRHISLAICAAALCASIPAFASDPSHEDAEKPWSLATGIGAVSGPRYLGSDHTKTRVVPIIKASYQTQWGKLMFGEDEGALRLGWSIAPNESTEFGIQVGQAEGRKEKDDSNLKGLGNLKNTTEFGFFASQRIDRFRLKMSANKGSSSGHGGTLLNLNGEYAYPLTDSLNLNGGIGMTWASNTYMQRYFGVSDAQAASSGLDRYTAKSGIRDVKASIGVTWQASQNWLLLAEASALRLQGDAKDSPIVKKSTQAQVMAGVVYRW